MDHQPTRRDSDDQQYAVVSNVPVEINNPQRKAKIIAAAWIAALLMCTFASGYIASLIAIEQNDDAKRQLRAEIEHRAQERDRQNQRLRDVLEEYRRDQCQVTARLPQDPAITEVRSRYRCTNPVVVAPTSGRPPPGTAPGSATPGAVLTYRPVPAPVGPPAGGTGARGVAPRPPAPPQTPTPPPQAPVPALPLPPPGPLPQPLPTCVRAVVTQICLSLELP